MSPARALLCFGNITCDWRIYLRARGCRPPPHPTASQRQDCATWRHTDSNCHNNNSHTSSSSSSSNIIKSSNNSSTSSKVQSGTTPQQRSE